MPRLLKINTTRFVYSHNPEPAEGHCQYMKTILITGASGLIGSHLTSLLLGSGYRVLHLGRSNPKNGRIETFIWNISKSIIDDNAVKQADYIIHLAGAGITDKRWTKERKEEITSSRTKSTRLLFESIQRNNRKPQAFISASAIGFYGAVTQEKIFTEDEPAGTEFLGTCCKLWEASVDQLSSLNIRIVKIRVGVVLASDGGAMPLIARPVRFGLGAAIGSGKQHIPWIHIDDICGIFLKAIEDIEMHGAYNAVAPEPVTNGEFNTCNRKNST